MISTRSVAAPLSAVIAAATVAAASPPARADDQALTTTIDAYVECINRLSERAYDSIERYASWVGKQGPTGKERIIYGTYTIDGSAGCKEGVEKANAAEPDDPELEAAASAYAEAVVGLEPLLKEADDYYTQEDYKDDKMAKGKAMHPRLVAAWDAFRKADTALRAGIDTIQDRMDIAMLAEIEKADGRKGRWHVKSIMIGAKRVLKAEDAAKPDVTAITAAVADFEATIKAAEAIAAAGKESGIGSSFLNDARSYLTTAKQLMRRIRDKTPYSSGEKMLMDGGGGAWMVEGSPARLTRDYNQLVEAYNRGPGF
jgi:hypothetical protein